MVEAKEKKKTTSGKKSNNKSTYIIFGILVVILIVFTIILLKPKTVKYAANFGENITTTIELNAEKINMNVKVGSTEVKQSGKLVELKKGEDDAGKWVIYEATLDPKTEKDKPEVVQIKVYDKSLILAYDSGETVTYYAK